MITKQDYLDAQPLPDTLPAEMRRGTAIAAEIRSSKILLKIAEGLIINRITGRADAFTELCVRSYLGDDWQEYLAILGDDAKVLKIAETIRNVELKISPITCALVQSKDREIAFDPAAHLRVVSDAIVDAVSGRGEKFIAVSMPPRHGKSTLISRRSAAWFLANWPTKFVGITSYGDEFASTWGRIVRNDIEDLPERFGFGIAKDSSAAASWHDTLDGGLWTGGVGGAITGKGASYLVVDDPVKNREAASSRVERDRAWSWWTSTVRTRMTGAGAFCVVDGTKWDSDDLLGRLVGGYDGSDASEWKVIRLSAQAEENDLLGRAKGKPLWPGGGFDEEALAKIKSAIGDADWAALYQQLPLDETSLNKAYRFDPVVHVKEVDFDPTQTLYVGCDFNISPWSAVLAQVREFRPDLRDILTNRRHRVLEVCAELSLTDCTTSEAASELVELLRKMAKGRKLRLKVAGDASGNQRRTSSGTDVPETDWSIFQDVLGKYHHLFSVTYEIRDSNPSVRERVGKLNSFLKPADGSVKFAVDKSCKVLINDLSKVTWARDASNNVRDTLSKKDAKLTHSSDALGYLAWVVGSETYAGEMPGHAR